MVEGFLNQYRQYLVNTEISKKEIIEGIKRFQELIENVN
jgi:hypothetical protein